MLVNSLGERGTVVEHTYSGFGKTGRAWRVNWRPVRFNPFLLPRKAKGLETWGPGQSWKRRVVSVAPVEARETACIGVGSPDNTYLCTAQRLVTHNTGIMLLLFTPAPYVDASSSWALKRWWR